MYRCAGTQSFYVECNARTDVEHERCGRHRPLPRCGIFIFTGAGMAQQTVLILDFGGQYKELIARRVRECNVYSVVKPGDRITVEQILEIGPIGIILTGGPNSVYEDGSPRCDKNIFKLGIPILGICYGVQLLAWSCGGTVAPCLVSEYGKTAMRVDTGSNLFKGLNAAQIGLMSHTDQIVKLPEGFRSVACTDNCPNAAIENKANRLYGMQFHPEVESTSRGTDMIHNFLYRVCGAEGDYDLHNLQEQLIRDIRDQVGDKHVLLALSGGVDSSVCAALLSRAIPGQLHCVFVDHGLMRKNEGDDVEAAFSGRDLHFIRVNAGERFLAALRGITDPEQKRKIIGAEFVKVFEEERELTVMLLIDVSGSRDFGSVNVMKKEVITEIAATLAFSAIQNNDKIGVVFFSDKIEKFIPPQKGKKHILYIIRELIDFHPEETRTDISQVLKYLTNAIKKRCTAFLISDFIDKEGFKDALTVANRKHDMVAIQVYDRRETELPAVGLMKIKDAETGKEQWIDSSSAGVRAAYKEWWEKRQAKMSDTFKKCRVDSVSVRTEDDYVKALIALFDKRN